jgi:hypothetical protein
LIDHHFRDLGKRRYRVARPVEVRDHGTVEGNLLFECVAHGQHDGAFNLIPKSVWIDDLSAVVRDKISRLFHRGRKVEAGHRPPFGRICR